MGIRKYFVDKMLLSSEIAEKKRLADKLFPKDINEIIDLNYANDNEKGHMLDIYYPCIESNKVPILINMHGGGFLAGDKESNRLFGYHMAKLGFLVFNVNYRLADSKVKVSQQIKDIAAATAWIRRNSKNYNGDNDKVFLCGHSAGGVLAVMEALNATSERLRKIYDITEQSFEQYQGLMLDCGMLTFYQNTIGYWGMRGMVFERNYLSLETYKNMIWEHVPEFKLLPKTYLISNRKDELRAMTLKFQEILTNMGILNKLNYQNDLLLGHTAILYNPESLEGKEVLREAVKFLLA